MLSRWPTTARQVPAHAAAMVTTHTTAAVRAAELSKVYGAGDTAVRALDGVSADFADEQFTAIMGPSGSGKSTLLHLLGGLERPTSGEIWLDGRRVDGLSQAKWAVLRRRHIGFVFQFFNLVSNMTVADNVELAALMGGASKRQAAERCAELLAELGLSDKAGAAPARLSGGEQQRVALARALVGGTKVVLFDEPLSNVDARVRRRLRRMLRQLKEEIGFSGIYVTHDQEEALELADVIAVMRNGRIEQVGSPHEIYERPANMYVADFIGGGVVNQWEATVTGAEAGTVTVSTAIGAFEVPLADTQQIPAAGGKGWLGVRPHFIQIANPDPAAADPPRAVRALVTDQVFFGTHVEYRMTAAGAVVIANLQVDQEPPGRVGDEVLLSFAEGRALWLPR